MKLRCISEHHRPFKPGKFYDVVEILELPNHAMVRKPNGKWPKPGDRFFAWHADEIFECPPGGIPAYSCGYNYIEEEFFGAIIPHSVFPFLRSARQASDRLDNIVDACSDRQLWWGCRYGVVTRVCAPENLESRFILVGADHWKLGRELSCKKAEAMIQTILKALKIPAAKMPLIGDQQMEFWSRSGYREAGPWIWRRPRDLVG